MPKIVIIPDDKTIPVAEGTNLLTALQEAGIALDASCGGEGVCGQCRVRLRGGALEGKAGSRQNREDYAAGWRQACRSKVTGDLIIEIPPESRIDSEVIVERHEAPAGQFLSEEQIASLNPGWKFDPPLKKLLVKLPPPTKEDNVSDMNRLARSLKLDHDIKHLQADLDFLRALPQALRDGDWTVTVTLIWTRAIDAFLEPGERAWRRPMVVQVEPGVYRVFLREEFYHRPVLIRVEPGDTRDQYYALALDVGTTTVSGEVVDVAKGESLCVINEYNSQVQHGADVISRIIYALKPGGLETMQGRAAESINRVIAQLTRNCGIKPEEISHLCAAGNTTMTHLLLKLYPKWLRESPYVPVTNRAGSVLAKDQGLDAGPWARLYTFPCVASYVGGDTVAGALATGIYKRKTTALFIDIGTNAEIVIGNQDFLLTASCSAGPAFEGGGIACGMHAGPGAVERFKVEPHTFKVRYDTIRYQPARGICGSGLINIAASLLEAGIIEPNGRVNLSSGAPLVREGPEGPEVVIVPAAKTAMGVDLTLNEADLNNLIRAKAAMFAGYSTLLEHVGLAFDKIEDVFLAGNFGNTLDIENAVTIGLLPDIDRNKFKFVGNSSLRGARLVLQSSQLLHEAENVARMMTNVEFWDNPRFMEHYMASMFLPHTNENVFPSVFKRLAQVREEAARRGRSAGGLGP